MLAKRRFFASALLALVLLSAAACAQIDLAPYEIPNSAMAQITLIQPGLFLIRHDSTMNDGTSFCIKTASPYSAGSLTTMAIGGCPRRS